jgi:hypothetical protein
MVVGCGLSAPLRRVVQARRRIVKRYIHGARGSSSYLGGEDSVKKWEVEGFAGGFS